MTGPDLRELGADEYAGWFEANRSALSDRGPFHEPAWLDAVARGVGFDLRFVGAFEGGELAAVVPGFLARRGPFRLFGSPLRGTMTSYLGPVTLDADHGSSDPVALSVACADFARRTWGAKYARFTGREAAPERQPAPGPDWHQQRPGSYRLELTAGEEALFAGLKSHCRRNVRKATREGVEIVPLDDPELFYRILQDTMHRHGSASWHPPRFFETIMRELPPLGLLCGWGARFDEQIIAAGLFLHDDREMHFISGASLLRYGSLPTSYLLHWHAIAQAVRDGLLVFNSEASGIPSIDQFKETFNPVRERRSTLIWAPRSVWAAQRAFKRWHKGVRRMRGRIAVG